MSSPSGSTREAEELRARFNELFWIGAERRLLRAGARPREAAGRLALLEHRPSALERDRAARAGGRRRRRADGDAASGRAGACGRCAATDAGLQPALVPQRHRLAARQLADRLGPRRGTAAGPRRSGSCAASLEAAVTSSTSCPRSSPASRAPTRPSRSHTRRPRARRHGRPARRCSFFSSCSACGRTGDAAGARVDAPPELPSWAGAGSG